MQDSSAMQCENSTVGKSIVIKGEIVASDPLYVYGCVDGSISAPEQRVTIGREGMVKADITAREVVIMGDVCGSVDVVHRVEIRREGSFTGDLCADRIRVEEGAVFQAVIDIRKPNEKDNPETNQALELGQTAFTPESEDDREAWTSLAVSEPA